MKSLGIILDRVRAALRVEATCRLCSPNGDTVFCLVTRLNERDGHGDDEGRWPSFASADTPISQHDHGGNAARQFSTNQQML